MKASIADVKKGYKKLAIQHHPDKVMETEEKKKEAKIKFQKIFFHEIQMLRQLLSS